MDRHILYVAAKAPRQGYAKTRLGRAIGHDRAVALYRAFLRDLADRFASASFEVGWYVTPQDAWSDLGPLVDGHGCRPQVLAQPHGDWTERQRHLFATASERREERVILVGSDSPHIEAGVITNAFASLAEHDIVIGPVRDGGYYLIGMRGWHDVLQGIPMSTRTVLKEIRARARDAGLSVAEAPTTFDVDEEGDLGHLVQTVQARDDLPATHAALLCLGLMALPTSRGGRDGDIR